MDYIMRNYQNLYSILLCLTVMMLVSCKDAYEKDIVDKVDKMRHERTIIPFEKLSCYYADQLSDTVYHGHDYKYVFFADSNECASCMMNSLYDYMII